MREELAVFYKFITLLGEKGREILANHFTSRRRKKKRQTQTWGLFITARAN